MAVGVLAGFGAGLLIAGLLIVGRVDRHMTRPVDAVVASMSSAPPTTTGPGVLASPAAQPPQSSPTVTTVTETHTVIKTEQMPAPAAPVQAQPSSESPQVQAPAVTVTVSVAPQP
jgi:hypothetical protein